MGLNGEFSVVMVEDGRCCLMWMIAVRSGGYGTDAVWYVLYRTLLRWSMWQIELWTIEPVVQSVSAP
jgi:hypothetical protein